MAFSVTYSFTNGSTSDATQVNTNFQDVINATSDGTEDFSISALTCAGAATFNGNVTLGNGSVDDITFTGSLASSIPIKTTFSYDVGIATVGIKSIYFGDDGSAARTTRLIGGTVASSHTITLMEDGGTAGYAVETNGSGVLSYGLKMRVGDTHNIGLAAAQTSVAADSIKIQGAAAALSATNPGYLCLPNATSGLVSVFKVTADVTIDLTGAHWGRGTDGDLTDYILTVYAINDAGTLKWGVAAVYGHDAILNADDTATATSVTSVEKVLVNSSLGADAGCIHVGWFKANFDDTGGSSEDLWTVQTGLSDINLGKTPNHSKIFTPSGNMTSNVTYTGLWTRDSEHIYIDILMVFSSNADAVNLIIVAAPSGLLINTTNLLSTAFGQQIVGNFNLQDSGAFNYHGPVTPDAATPTTSVVPFTGTGALDRVTNTAPVTIASGDAMSCQIKVPISGWI